MVKVRQDLLSASNSLVSSLIYTFAIQQVSRLDLVSWSSTHEVYNCRDGVDDFQFAFESSS